MLDDLNELKTLQQILTAGSLSGAARMLGTSLAVVSKRLATLERRTGVRLVNRSTRALSPTEEGVRLLVHIDSALEALAAGEVGLTSGRDEPVGRLRISAPVSLGRLHVAPVLAQLAEGYDKLSVSLTLDDRLANLVGDGIDVAIRIGGLTDSSAIMRKLADNNRVLVASPGYLDRAGRPEVPAEMENHAFLRYGNAVAPWTLQGPNGAEASLPARARFRVDNGDALHDWALAGHGIMLKSRIDVAADLDAERLEIVLPGWSGGDAPIVALYSSARHLPIKTRLFLDAMAARLSGK
jgi:DNA-binding transcriptional LysR family regulator